MIYEYRNNNNGKMNAGDMMAGFVLGIIACLVAQLTDEVEHSGSVVRALHALERFFEIRNSLFVFLLS